MSEIKACRMCGSDDLVEVFRIGYIYPSGFVRSLEQIVDKHPLILVQCNHCFLIQLKHTISLDFMYREYWYRSGLNSSMVDDLKDVVESVEDRIELCAGDIVVDIGCNDGTLFDFYEADVIKVGYDPAYNLSSTADEHCDIFINDYFKPVVGIDNVRVVTAIAMFYDLPDPIGFLLDIKSILAENGIAVLQFTDLYSMFRINAFDNICHEHLEYYMLYNLVWAVESAGLEIFDVEYNKVNGGSIRVYLAHPYTQEISPNVEDARYGEETYFNSPSGEWYSFRERVGWIKDLVTDFLWTAKEKELAVYLLGASTKGNTLLQYFGIDHGLIPIAAEINPDKFGLYTVGSNIYILNEKDILATNPPAYFFVPTWHFIDHFVKMPHLMQYMDNGGKLVVPMPWPRVYYRENGETKWMLLKNHLEFLLTSYSQQA